MSLWVMRTAIYVRVSTAEQSFDSQLQELEGYCRRRGWADTSIYSDHASGSGVRRAGLETMLRDVRAGRVARVVVYKLDRLGRSLPHLALILSEFGEHKVAFICTSQGIDTTDSNPAGRLQLGVLMAVAEFERELIRERVNAGLSAARSRGVKLGRRRSHAITRDQVEAMLAGGLSQRGAAKQLGISLRAFKQ
jgi:DNA invertase Pin-like site-specific DNA recombinase